jgi:hypothetical protein
MLITCWSVKGGAGVSVVTAALAGLLAQRHGSAAIVDLGGDQPAALGLAEPNVPGVLDWCDSSAGAEQLARLAIQVGSDLLLVPRGEGRQMVTAGRAAELALALAKLAPAVVVDAGMPLGATQEEVGAPGVWPHAEYLRRCGSSLFITRACYMAMRRAKALEVTADGVIFMDEPGRALNARDVSEVLGLPVVGVVEADPEVTRAVDSGTLARRIPASLARGLRRAG